MDLWDPVPVVPCAVRDLSWKEYGAVRQKFRRRDQSVVEECV
ncbi:hypothetical protein [Alloactinosynnema sp. L-07]|nr:hypothetical protein [Alloactinosynnema sp. L-07]